MATASGTKMASGNKILGHAKAAYQWVNHLLSLHEGNPINLRYPLLPCLGRAPERGVWKCLTSKIDWWFGLVAFLGVQ